MNAEQKQRPFYIVGPTAVGKSRIAVEVAERVGGEIVGADAFQVYAGLDILSAKPSADLRDRVPHHLIGEIPLSTRFDVGQWLGRAREAVAEVAGRGRIPIICGGAGLYVRALATGLAELPPANLELRATFESEPLALLVERLHALDPETSVDMQNPRRVIRALEVCLLAGRPFSSFRTEWNAESAMHGAVLALPREIHDAAISARTDAMFEAGVVPEVASVGEVGPTASGMIGLAEIRDLLAGRTDEATCRATITLATRQYAKRQLTWFRKEKGIDWLDLAAIPDAAEILAEKIKSTASEN